MNPEAFDRTMKSMDHCEKQMQRSIEIVNENLNGRTKPILRRATDWFRRITQQK